MSTPRQFARPSYGLVPLVALQIVTSIACAVLLYLNASGGHGWLSAISGATAAVLVINAMTLVRIWRLRKQTAELIRQTELLHAQFRAADWRDHHA